MDTLSRRAPPDVVNDLLDSLRVRSTVYCRSNLRAPWGFGVRAHGNPAFHVVTQGDCWLEIEDDGAPLHLGPGDLVLLPAGPTHWMRDEQTSPTEWLDEILAGTRVNAQGRLGYGGTGRRSEIVCGGFVLEGERMNPILRTLPPVIHVRSASAGPAPWVAATLELVAAITASDAPGAEAVLRRLSDAMLTQALRTALGDLAAADRPTPFALRDPQIATAIHRIHERPERRWTVDRLAAEVAYSRSAFAARFRELVGESPMTYVTRTRLAVAATMLERTGATLDEVARRVGYRSASSFSRAFKRAFGLAPGAYRAKPAKVPRPGLTRSAGPG